jgi:hypothetical protein
MKAILLALAIGLSAPCAQAQAPARIVVLTSDVSDMVIALGAAAQVVGRDRSSRQPELAHAAEIGVSRALSVEPIAPLKPTLVLGSSQAQPPGIWRQLHALGLDARQVSAREDGRDFADAVRVLQQDAAENGVILRLLGVTASYKELLEADFPGKFNYTYSDDYNDYIYSVEKMANLSGKKYHGKRGHITYFMKAYPDWQFEVLTPETVGECIALHTSWIDEKDQTEQKEEDAEFSLEFEAVLSAFDNYKALGFVGGLIRVDGKVIAYTMGEPHSKDCFVTHFEKAPADMRGAFPIINQVFTRQCLSGYTYVNREEDLGLEGLRKAKQSYHPEIFLEKCVATYVDEN